MHKILIFFSDTGGGHRAAAEAIREALAVRFAGRYMTVIEDAIVRGARWPLSRVPKSYRPTVTYAPWLYGRLFHSSDRGVLARSVNPSTKAILSRGLQRILVREEPDLVVSVHPLINYAVRQVLNKRKSRIPFVTVVTDLFDIHSAWYSGDADLVIVPTPGAKERALKHGVPEQKIRVVGLPVSLKFVDVQMETQSELRMRLALKDMFTVLLVGGGEGMGKLFEIATAISNARLPVQLVVVAGRNPRLEKKLKAYAWQIPVKINGFVMNMPDWMRAADLIITKAGPGTIMEALACGLPIVLSGFLPGQEEGNVTFVEESGVGELVREPRAIAEKLRVWLRPRDSTLARWRTRARELAHPGAALEIAATLDEVLENFSPETPSRKPRKGTPSR